MPMRSVRSPVLLIAFRRPDLTEQVLNAIRGARPARFYVAIDGPRSDVPGEAELVVSTRDLIERAADWNVELHVRARTENLGCRKGVADAIDWFFTHEPEGIILEDDCVPHPDFFTYCDELLERFRDDPRIFAICGDNSSSIELSGPWSYGFIRHPNVWGWASWRRAWAHYDDSMEDWRRVTDDPDALRLIFPEQREREAMKALLDRLAFEGRPDTWDYRWTANCILATAMCAIPRVNMVTNIGFRSDATHTVRPAEGAGLLARSPYPLSHPPIAVLDRQAERHVFLRGSDLLTGWPRWRRRIATAARLAIRPKQWRAFSSAAKLRLAEFTR
jgi:hypothetical protein